MTEEETLEKCLKWNRECNLPPLSDEEVAAAVASIARTHSRKTGQNSFGTLEDGLPANILEDLGRGSLMLTETLFSALSDRGPNATPYNSTVDDTVSYISRFQTINMALTPNAPGSSLPFTLTPTVTQTTLLSSPTALNYGTGAGLGFRIDGVTPIGSGAPPQNTSTAFYFTGRSDNFGPGNSGNASNARFDPKSIRASPTMVRASSFPTNTDPTCDSSIGQPDNKSRALHFLAI